MSNFNNKKTSLALSAVMIINSLICPVSTVAFATEDTTDANITQVVKEICKYESPYFGYAENDFDINNDGAIDVFDVIEFKKYLIEGEPDITIATIVKLEGYLLNTPYGSLEITDAPSTWYTNVTDEANDVFRNLTSHDFRFVHAEETIAANLKDPDSDYSRGIVLYFLGIDELVKESVFIDKICSSPYEFDEIITETENDGFYIGVKDDSYAIAVKKFDPAYAVYDLKNVDSEQVDYLIADLTKQLNNENNYEIQVDRSEDDVIIKCKTTDAIMDLIVKEGTFSDSSTVIYENESMVLFVTDGTFGISIK